MCFFHTSKVQGWVQSQSVAPPMKQPLPARPMYAADAPATAPTYPKYHAHMPPPHAAPASDIQARMPQSLPLPHQTASPHDAASHAHAASSSVATASPALSTTVAPPPALPPAAAPAAAPGAAGSTPSAESNSSTAALMVSSSFLRDLTHQHDWLFGALAELVHNSRDAHAKTCRISVQRLGAAQKPHLIVEDDGVGMTHTELRHAFSFGRVAGRTREDASIGRFGFGMKHVRLHKTQGCMCENDSGRSAAVPALAAQLTRPVPVRLARCHLSLYLFDLFRARCDWVTTRWC